MVPVQTEDFLKLKPPKANLHHLQERPLYSLFLIDRSTHLYFNAELIAIVVDAWRTDDHNVDTVCGTTTQRL